MLDKLPQELILEIAEFLSVKNIIRLHLTCRNTYHAIEKSSNIFRTNVLRNKCINTLKKLMVFEHLFYEINNFIKEFDKHIETNFIYFLQRVVDAQFIDKNDMIKYVFKEELRWKKMYLSQNIRYIPNFSYTDVYNKIIIDNVNIDKLHIDRNIGTILIKNSNINNLILLKDCLYDEQYCNNKYYYNKEYEIDIRNSHINNLNVDDNIVSTLKINNKNSIPNFLFDATYTKNIKTLNLSKCNLSDISFLKDFEKLEYLDFSRNKISNIDVLEKLNNLSIVNLSHNLIENIYIINQEYTSINLSHNKIRDITPFNNKIIKFDLNLSNNEISDVSSMNIPSLRCKISLRNNLLKEFKVVNLKNIRSILISGNQLTGKLQITNNDDPLTMHNEFPILDKIDVSFNYLTDISCLENFSRLNTILAINNSVKLSLNLSKFRKNLISKL